MEKVVDLFLQRDLAKVKTKEIEFSSLEDGSVFEHCVKKDHWDKKTWDENVEVTERLKSGCCPKGFVFGTKARFWGEKVNSRGAVMCGFSDDMEKSDFKVWRGKCNLGKCVINKPKYKCSDDKMPMLSGRCPGSPPKGCVVAWKNGFEKFQATTTEYHAKACKSDEDPCDAAGGYKTWCKTCEYPSPCQTKKDDKEEKEEEEKEEEEKEEEEKEEEEKKKKEEEEEEEEEKEKEEEEKEEEAKKKKEEEEKAKKKKEKEEKAKKKEKKEKEEKKE